MEDILCDSKVLCETYKNDNKEQSFQEEYLHARLCVQNSHLSAFKLFQNRKKEREPNQLKLYEIFPNVVIALNIFLGIAITNCSAECYFSILKRIKNYLRANLTEKKLNSLETLCIE